MSTFKELSDKTSTIPERLKRSLKSPHSGCLGFYDTAKCWLFDFASYDEKARLLVDIATVLEESTLKDQERYQCLAGAYLYILSTLTDTSYHSWINQSVCQFLLRDLSLKSLSDIPEMDYKAFLLQLSQFLSEIICDKKSQTYQKLFKPGGLPANIQLTLSNLTSEKASQSSAWSGFTWSFKGQ